MKKLLLIAVVSVFAALPAVALPNITRADDGEDHSQTEMTVDEAASAGETTEAEATTGSYDYVAQAHDTYHELSRKAIQTYGIETETNLSGAQIIFAETMLTQEAGSPALAEGQEVSISKDMVKSWVEKAQDLTDEQESAWDYYVQFVDFDTSDNGEARS